MKLESSYLVGRTLVNVFASTTPLIGKEVPGLGQPSFYDVVLLLDQGERLSLLCDELKVWPETERLTPVTSANFNLDPTIVFRNQVVVDVRHDDLGDLIVVLGNGATLSVGVPYGTAIDLRSPATS
jgi:hypothetical protein